jgi:uncharacterized protein YdhG (YjbR/CyaY superfamily)
MTSKAETVEQYLQELPAERQEAVGKLREILRRNLPSGFEEVISYGMIGYVVPHSIYPDGYHCDTKLPLPFINLASQKNYIALYHSGLYAKEDVLQWFQQEYAKRSKGKLDMGKSCIRFKKPEHIPYDLIAELAQKFTPREWIELYEGQVKNARRR